MSQYYRVCLYGCGRYIKVGAEYVEVGATVEGVLTSYCDLVVDTMVAHGVKSITAAQVDALRGPDAGVFVNFSGQACLRVNGLAQSRL